MEQRRIRLAVRYDGTDFAGSQVQPGRRTVAGTLKAGLESLLGQSVHLLFAGRTDAGVHAEENVCTFDAALPLPVDRLAQVLNRRLPPDLRVRSAAEVPQSFHPRYSARTRVYAYRVYRSMDVPVDRLRFTMPYEGPWNEVAVQHALSGLAGRHSFSSFAVGSLLPRYSLCTMDPVEFGERGPEIFWRFRANRFLRQMVRRLAGALLEVAAGRVGPQQFAEALSGPAGFQFKPALSQGLTLLKIEYDS